MLRLALVAALLAPFPAAAQRNAADCAKAAMSLAPFEKSLSDLILRHYAQNIMNLKIQPETEPASDAFFVMADKIAKAQDEYEKAVLATCGH